MSAMNIEVKSPGATWHEGTDQLFRNAMGSYLTGITIVTTTDEDGEHVGMAASSIASVTTSPPTLLVCLNRSTKTRHTVMQSGGFVVNILAADQSDVVRSFARRNDTGSKLDGIPHAVVPGYGVAIDNAIASILCKVGDSVVQGTHEVVFGRVERIAYRDGMPLAYFQGEYDALPKLADRTETKMSLV